MQPSDILPGIIQRLSALAGELEPHERPRGNLGGWGDLRLTQALQGWEVALAWFQIHNPSMQSPFQAAIAAVETEWRMWHDETGNYATPEEPSDPAPHHTWHSA